MTRVPWIPRVQHQPWHLHGHRLVKRFGIGHFPHAFAEERYGRPANRRENSDHRHDDQQLTHTGQGRCVESKKKKLLYHYQPRIYRGQNFISGTRKHTNLTFI